MYLKNTFVKLVHLLGEVLRYLIDIIFFVLLCPNITKKQQIISERGFKLIITKCSRLTYHLLKYRKEIRLAYLARGDATRVAEIDRVKNAGDDRDCVLVLKLGMVG